MTRRVGRRLRVVHRRPWGVPCEDASRHPIAGHAFHVEHDVATRTACTARGQPTPDPAATSPQGRMLPGQAGDARPSPPRRGPPAPAQPREPRYVHLVHRLETRLWTSPRPARVSLHLIQLDRYVNDASAPTRQGSGPRSVLSTWLCTKGVIAAALWTADTIPVAQIPRASCDDPRAPCPDAEGTPRGAGRPDPARPARVQQRQGPAVASTNRHDGRSASDRARSRRPYPRGRTTPSVAPVPHAHGTVTPRARRAGSAAVPDRGHEHRRSRSTWNKEGEGCHPGAFIPPCSERSASPDAANPRSLVPTVRGSTWNDDDPTSSQALRTSPRRPSDPSAH